MEKNNEIYNKKKVLGLDIGVKSLGWAINYFDEEKKQWDIYDFGVRIWDSPEDSKSLETKTNFRREKRSSRRLNERKNRRLRDLTNFFDSNNLLSIEKWNQHQKKINEKNNNYNTEIKGKIKNIDYSKSINPIDLRYYGLENKLTNLQLLIALRNIAKNRGYNNKFNIPGTVNKDDRVQLTNAEDLIKKYKFPILAIVNNSNFNYKSSGFYFHNKGLKSKDKNEIKKNNEKQILFLREDYKNEANSLLEKQSEFNKKLKDLKNDILDIIFRQRDFEDGPGPKDTQKKEEWKKWMENKDKNKDRINKIYKNNIYTSFHDSIGYCTFFKDQRRISSFSIEYDLNFILNEISKVLSKSIDKNNDKDYKNKIKNITSDILNSYKSTGKFSENELKESFKRNDLFYNKLNSGISFSNSHLFSQSFLVKNKDFVLKNLSLIDFDNLSESLKNNNFNKMGEVLFLNKTPSKLKEKLLKIDKDFFGDKNDNYEWLRENIKKIKEGGKVLQVSSKFVINSVNEQLKNGKLISIYQSELNKTNIEKLKEKDLNNEKIKLFSPINDSDMMKNSVVFRSINQVRLVIKRLFEFYGGFENVVIEVAKELYSEKKVRNSIRNKYENNNKKNEEIKEILISNNIDPTPNNIFKYKVWNQQKLKPTDEWAIDLLDINLKERIYLKDLFNGNNYNIDHIIPFSILNDNTISNKIIVSRSNNSEKTNKTPIGYFDLKNYSKKQIDSWKQIVSSKFFKNDKKKIEYLETENASRSSEFGFESRNINDTRYITKYISNYLKIEFEKWARKTNSKFVPNVFEIQGSITSRFRKLWLNPYSKYGSLWGDYYKPRDISPFHHAVDAIIVSNMISKQHIEFYQSIVRMYDYYNYLVGLNFDKKHIKDEIKNLKNILIKQLNSFYYKKNKNLNDFFISKINKIFEGIMNEIDSFSNLRRIDIFRNDVAYKNLWPVVYDLPKKVNDLIPVKLKLEDDPNFKENKKDETLEKRKIVSFERIVDQEEWVKINNKNSYYYPYVSYKLEKRIRGNFLGSETPEKRNEENYDFIKKIPKKGFLLDNNLNSNLWKINSFFGYKFDKKSKKIDLFLRKEMQDFSREKNIIKGFFLVKNSYFEIYNKNNNEKRLLIYKSIKNSKKSNIYVGDPQLSYTSNSTKYSNLFKAKNYKNTLNLSVILKNNDINLININFLGKNIKNK